MPYIHWEEVDKYLHRNQCLDWMSTREAGGTEGPILSSISNDPPIRIWENRIKNFRADQTATHPWTRERGNAELIGPSKDLETDAKLILAYTHEESPLHVRRTLDQSFYYTLSDQEIRLRDLDQVLYRHTTQQYGVNSPRTRILMVDQLWLWTIEEPGQPSMSDPRMNGVLRNICSHPLFTETIITAFPQTWGSLHEDPTEPSKPPTGLENLSQQANGSQPSAAAPKSWCLVLRNFESTIDGIGRKHVLEGDHIEIIRNGSKGTFFSFLRCPSHLQTHFRVVVGQGV